MSRANLFFKLEIEYHPDENPERIAEEIRRQLLRLYVVREAELSNFTTLDD
jgi:hypothetical protein